MFGLRRHSTCAEPGHTADSMPCSQLVAAITIAMPSIKRAPLAAFCSLMQSM
ncbi:hypothetical protein HDV64DRAFT_248165 [Trichoderma sp. TUCIM 5745]